MLPNNKNSATVSGWQGVGLIAITYIYFLIFAQFGFLKRLAELGVAADKLKPVMGAMALGGIAASLLAPWLERFKSPARRLQLAFVGCAVGAGLTLLSLNFAAALGVSLLIGAALGVLTVTLVTHLRSWMGERQPLFKVGLGVGLAYFICNWPALFDATPNAMAIVSAVLCFAGVALAAFTTREGEALVTETKSKQFLLALACFTALVWLDSAAFFIIQNTPALKAGTWEGAHRLWQNGGVHLLAALAGAWLLRARGLVLTLATAFIFLGGACLLLVDPARAALASVAYPAGVSIYSVALVAYPAFLANRSSARQRARLAGWLYAVAGWIGSGLGIGMGENLKHIPAGFVLAAATLLFAPLLWKLLQVRRREVLTLAVLLALAGGIFKFTSSPAQAQSLVEKGRLVYIAEGCLHCHSQFVRPVEPDLTLWATPTDVNASRAQTPPLIGNRRQGPDLATVGNRRSPLWLKAHFISPSSVSFNSSMPSYDHLFADERGEALLAYLESLGATNLTERLIAQGGWQLPLQAESQKRDGAKLVQQYCLTCHSADGAVRQMWGKEFKKLPPDFAAGPFIYAPATADVTWRTRRIAQIIKFGLPGTDMPGHEYLPDDEIAAMADYIAAVSAPKRP